MKLKRILALGGVILLVLLYVVALILAFVSHPMAPNLLMAALFCTVVVPSVLYGYQLVLKAFRRDKDD